MDTPLSSISRQRSGRPVPDYIPLISENLETLKNDLTVQLNAVKELLDQRRRFKLTQITRKFDELLAKLFIILQEYIDGALTDLLDFISNLKTLMDIYDKPLATFLACAEANLLRVEESIQQADGLIKKHSKTIVALSKTAAEITCLIKDYTDNSDTHLNRALNTGYTTIAGLSSAGIAAKVGFLAQIASPVSALRAVAVMTLSGGLVALFESQLSIDYGNAVTGLNRIQKHSDAFQAPINKIYKELRHTKGHLGKLRQDSLSASKNNDLQVQQSEYARAQDETQRIKKKCDEIEDLALHITVVQGELEYGLSRIPFATNVPFDEKTVSTSS